MATSTSYEQVKVTFVRIGNTSKLGIVLRTSAGEAGPPMIASIASNGAVASSSKVRRGDMLAAVNGVGTNGVPLPTVERMLDAPAVCLTLMRARCIGGDTDTATAAPAPSRLGGFHKAAVFPAPSPRQLLELSAATHRHESVSAIGAEKTDWERLHKAFLVFAAQEDVEQVRKCDLAVLLRVMGKAPTSADWNACPLVCDMLTWEHFQPWYDSVAFAGGHGGRAQTQTNMRQLAEMRKAFDNVDADGSGELDAAEIRVVMRRLGTAISKHESIAFVTLLDRDGDGTVSWSEFTRALTDDDFKATMPPAFAKFDISKLASLPSMLDDTKTISPEEHNRIVAQMAKLERFGVAFLQRRQRQKMLRSTFSDKHNARQMTAHKMERNLEEDSDEDDDMNDATSHKSHALSDKEKRFLRRTTNRAIFWAALAGVIAAVLPGLSEPQLEKRYKDVIDAQLLMAINLAIGLVASIIEVFVVYRVTFKTALQITQATGLVLYPVDSQRAFAASALVKTALELGNPTTLSSGVNPLKESSRFTMLLAALLYKAKRGLSTFLLKLFVKKVLPRYVAKEFLDLVAAPVNATWNALTMRKVMGAAKIVAMGPSAVCEVAGGLLRTREHVSPLLALQILRAVGVTMVVKRQVHPNIQVLQSIVLEYVSDKLPLHPSGLTIEDHNEQLRSITDDLAVENDHVPKKAGFMKDFFVGGLKKAKRQAELQFGSGDVKPVTAAEKRDASDQEYWSVFHIDDRAVLYAGMEKLGYDERCFVVCFIILSIVICGQTRKRERALYRDVVRACSHADQWDDVLRLVLVFKEGADWDERDVIAIATRESPPGEPTTRERMKKCSTCLCDSCAC